MKRYFQSVSNGEENEPRKQRRVFQPLEPSNESTVSSLQPDTKGVQSNVLRQEPCPTVPSSAVPIFDPSLFLLPETEQRRAEKLPKGSWDVSSNLLIKLSPDIDPSTRHKGVLAFDMDGTIIVTKSGKTFATNKNDWKLFDSSIPQRLLAAYEEGYLLAIISNQKGAKTPQDQLDVQSKFDAISRVLSVPIDMICSHRDDIYRKPLPGMCEFLYHARWKNMPMTLTRENCVYIGDAAGREQSGTRKKDFSDTDYKLALNLGIQFATPEKYFLNSTQKLHTYFPKPVNLLLQSIKLETEATSRWDERIFTPSSSSHEIVLLVAPPASGKSTLAREFMRRGYHRINQDELKDANACFRVARSLLSKISSEEGTSIVVDNTNLNPTVRSSWLKVAQEFNVKIRCIILNTPKDVCMMLSAFRLVDPLTLPEDRRKIETVVFHKFFKDPVFPRLDEGYERIDTVDWSPVLPESSSLSRHLFSMYIR